MEGAAAPICRAKRRRGRIRRSWSLAVPTRPPGRPSGRQAGGQRGEGVEGSARAREALARNPSARGRTRKFAIECGDQRGGAFEPPSVRPSFRPRQAPRLDPASRELLPRDARGDRQAGSSFRRRCEPAGFRLSIPLLPPTGELGAGRIPKRPAQVPASPPPLLPPLLCRPGQLRGAGLGSDERSGAVPKLANFPSWTSGRVRSGASPRRVCKRRGPAGKGAPPLAERIRSEGWCREMPSVPPSRSEVRRRCPPPAPRARSAPLYAAPLLRLPGAGVAAAATTQDCIVLRSRGGASERASSKQAAAGRGSPGGRLAERRGTESKRAGAPQRRNALGAGTADAQALGRQSPEGKALPSEERACAAARRTTRSLERERERERERVKPGLAAVGRAPRKMGKGARADPSKMIYPSLRRP
ncbi:uncharacterized protein LOC143840551 [Paroedura picta]|uniref:uncharacterized protein LOC143840551 n=1 Tax=Paroedura picta TaxID=143630 RepID=UPI004056A7EA